MNLLNGFVIHQRFIRGVTEDSHNMIQLSIFRWESLTLEKKKCCLECTTLIENVSICGQNHEKATIKATTHF